MTAVHAAAAREPSDLPRLHLTGSPVTVRPMTRRWISDVPSKMVKILAAGNAALFIQVNAGRGVARPDWNGLEATGNTSTAPRMLPHCSHRNPVHAAGAMSESVR